MCDYLSSHFRSLLSPYRHGTNECYRIDDRSCFSFLLQTLDKAELERFPSTQSMILKKHFHPFDETKIEECDTFSSGSVLIDLSVS
jgi:hypothetical protein